MEDFFAPTGQSDAPANLDFQIDILETAPPKSDSVTAPHSAGDVVPSAVSSEVSHSASPAGIRGDVSLASLPVMKSGSTSSTSPEAGPSDVSISAAKSLSEILAQTSVEAPHPNKDKDTKDDSGPGDLQILPVVAAASQDNVSVPTPRHAETKHNGADLLRDSAEPSAPLAALVANAGIKPVPIVETATPHLPSISIEVQNSSTSFTAKPSLSDSAKPSPAASKLSILPGIEVFSGTAHGESSLATPAQVEPAGTKPLSASPSPESIVKVLSDGILPPAKPAKQGSVTSSDYESLAPVNNPDLASDLSRLLNVVENVTPTPPASKLTVPRLETPASLPPVVKAEPVKDGPSDVALPAILRSHAPSGSPISLTTDTNSANPPSGRPPEVSVVQSLNNLLPDAVPVGGEPLRPSAKTDTGTLGDLIGKTLKPVGGNSELPDVIPAPALAHTTDKPVAKTVDPPQGSIVPLGELIANLNGTAVSPENSPITVKSLQTDKPASVPSSPNPSGLGPLLTPVLPNSENGKTSGVQSKPLAETIGLGSAIEKSFLPAIPSSSKNLGIENGAEVLPKLPVPNRVESVNSAIENVGHPTNLTTSTAVTKLPQLEVLPEKASVLNRQNSLVDGTVGNGIRATANETVGIEKVSSVVTSRTRTGSVPESHSGTNLNRSSALISKDAVENVTKSGGLANEYVSRELLKPVDLGSQRKSDGSRIDTAPLDVTAIGRFVAKMPMNSTRIDISVAPKEIPVLKTVTVARSSDAASSTGSASGLNLRELQPSIRGTLNGAPISTATRLDSGVAKVQFNSENRIDAALTATKIEFAGFSKVDNAATSKSDLTFSTRLEPSPVTKSDIISTVSKSDAVAIKSEITAGPKVDNISASKAEGSAQVKSDGAISIKIDGASGTKIDGAAGNKSDGVAAGKPDGVTAIKGDASSGSRTDTAVGRPLDGAKGDTGSRGTLTPHMVASIADAIRLGLPLPEGIAFQNGEIALRYNNEVLYFPGLKAALKFAEVVGLAKVEAKEDEAESEAGTSTWSVDTRVRYTVQEGETIESIAAVQLGDARFADLIVTINRAEILYRLAENVKVPFVYGGQVIWLPSDPELNIYRKNFFSKKSGGINPAAPRLSGEVTQQKQSGARDVLQSEFIATCGSSVKNSNPRTTVRDLPQLSLSNSVKDVADAIDRLNKAIESDVVNTALVHDGVHPLVDGMFVHASTGGDTMIAPSAIVSRAIVSSGIVSGAIVANANVSNPIVSNGIVSRDKTSSIVVPSDDVSKANVPKDNVSDIDCGLSTVFVAPEPERLIDVKILARDARIVVSDFASNPSNSFVKLEICVDGVWAAAAVYDCTPDATSRTRNGKNGVKSTMILHLPSPVVRTMAVEDFSRNWSVYRTNYIAGNVKNSQVQSVPPTPVDFTRIEIRLQPSA